ncbi:MAG: AtpZ/AtpI family protein [Flavobacteriales bacterium]|nr:AtpZ/AtpI family protein [Flavobacteriales bacterium]
MSDKKFMRFSTLGVQMAVLIYLGSELGKYLDEKYASQKGLYTAVCVVAAVGISLYQLVKGLPKDE